eukprot:SAG22_NODE_429_length_10587_cov_22.842582_3_plen_210_part_00
MHASVGPLPLEQNNTVELLANFCRARKERERITREDCEHENTRDRSLPHRREKSHRKPAAPARRQVGLGAVEQPVTVQADLAGSQHQRVQRAVLLRVVHLWQVFSSCKQTVPTSTAVGWPTAPTRCVSTFFSSGGEMLKGICVSRWDWHRTTIHPDACQIRTVMPWLRMWPPVAGVLLTPGTMRRHELPSSASSIASQIVTTLLFESGQ